jgi:predicted nucleic acid-binding protein
VLAKERDATLLVDEREARRVALQLGIGYVGSLRVLTEAKERGIIVQVKPVLDELIAAGLYIGEPLYQSVLRSVGEA